MLDSFTEQHPVRLISPRSDLRSPSMQERDAETSALSELVLFESQLEVVADFCFGAGASRDLANSRLDETVARGAERSSRVGGLDG